MASSNDTAGSDSVIKPIRIKSSAANEPPNQLGMQDLCQLVNEIKLGARNDSKSKERPSDDGLGLQKGFVLFKVPTCQVEDKEESTKELPGTRSGSSNDSIRKSIRRQSIRKASVSSFQPKIDIKIVNVQKSGQKSCKLLEFRNKVKQSVDSGEHQT